MYTVQEIKRKTWYSENGQSTDKQINEVPPLTYCGVDMFGPFIIKQRRSEVKRYGGMFTCMNTRAVHIEVTHSLDIDSFIQALRRMIA